MPLAAIMTTDTHSKEYAVCYRSEAAGHAGNAYTVGGMCKGSGMIMPNMATMIAVITTDAPVEPAALHALLLSTVKQTFNKVTVDSDTSTNDTCIMLASAPLPQMPSLLSRALTPSTSWPLPCMRCARAWRATSPQMARAHPNS